MGYVLVPPLFIVSDLQTVLTFKEKTVILRNMYVLRNIICQRINVLCGISTMNIMLFRRSTVADGNKTRVNTKMS